MMKLFLSLFLLNVFTSVSNGDICITTDSYYSFAGNYVDMGSDSNGNKYYKEEDIGACDDNYIFKLGSKFFIGQGYDATDGSYTALNVQCSTLNIASPTACQDWGVTMTVSDGSCPETLTNTCGSITISGVGSFADGMYDKTADGLYQRVDNAFYLSWWEAGRYYSLNDDGDVRCQGSGVSSYARIGEDQLDGITVGQELTITPLYSCCSSTVSIACTTAASSSTGTGTGTGSGATPAPITPAPITPAPTTPAPTPVSGLGSVCLSTEYTGTLTSGSGISIALSKLAGEYTEISGGINGRPAYELVNSGTDCGVSSTLMYVEDGYNKYMFVRNRNQPGSTYYFSCSNTASISNNDVTQCEFGSVDDIVTLSSGSSTCQCGRTTPSPTTPAPQISVPLSSDSLCFAVLQSYADQSYSIITNGVTTLLTSIAGQYELITESDENNKPIYQLSSSCGKDSYIKYVSAFSMYMVVLDVDNPTSTYVTWCQNSGSITDNDVTQCSWRNGDKYTITDAISSCSCEQTVSSI